MDDVTPVQLDALPRSIEDFMVLRDAVAATPQGGAAMMVVALIAYAQDSALGQQCLTVAVDKSDLVQGPHGYKGWQLRNTSLHRVRDQLSGRDYLPRSYVVGATPDNGYRLPDPPYVVAWYPDPRGAGPDTETVKVFVSCSGANSARPVTVHADGKGHWKATEWSSLLVGIQEPEDQGAPDL